MSRAVPIWYDLPIGMTISLHHKGPNKRVYLSFRCCPFGASNPKTAHYFPFNYDNYPEKYEAALDWIKINRFDYVEPRKHLTRTAMINRLNLKKVVVKRTVLISDE